MGNTFRTVYSLSAFNSAKAASGELCVMVVSNYSGSTIDNIIPNSGNNATGGTPNAEFKGAGICSYNNPDYYTLVIDEVAYTFNGYGNASSRNAVGWKLMMGTPQDDVVEIGNAVARTSTASTIKNSQGAIGTVVDYSTPSTVMVGSITARDEFAVQALKCLLAHIPDPSILSPKEISYYCHAAYEWAAGMMTAAAKARTTYTDNSGSSTATTKQVGELETNTEKLLNNLIVAVNGISGGGGSSLSAPLTLINGIGNPPAPEGLLAKKYLLSWNGSTYSWSDFEDALNLPLSAINGLNTNPPATASGKILVFKTSLLYPSGSWGYEDLPTGGSGTIADGSVTTAKLANGAVTHAKLDTDSVDTDNLVAKSVTTAILDDLAVTNDKIANRTITEAKFADGAIINAIGNGSIHGVKLNADTKYIYLGIDSMDNFLDAFIALKPHNKEIVKAKKFDEENYQYSFYLSQKLTSGENVTSYFFYKGTLSYQQDNDTYDFVNPIFAFQAPYIKLCIKSTGDNSSFYNYWSFNLTNGPKVDTNMAFYNSNQSSFIYSLVYNIVNTLNTTYGLQYAAPSQPQESTINWTAITSSISNVPRFI